MKKVIDYKVEHAFGKEILETQIFKLITEGWQPIGGISFAHINFEEVDSKELVWAQAMVLYDESKS